MSSCHHYHATITIHVFIPTCIQPAVGMWVWIHVYKHAYAQEFLYYILYCTHACTTMYVCIYVCMQVKEGHSIPRPTAWRCPWCQLLRHPIWLRKQQPTTNQGVGWGITLTYVWTCVCVSYSMSSYITVSWCLRCPSHLRRFYHFDESISVHCHFIVISYCHIFKSWA